MSESLPIPFREGGVDPRLPPLLLFFGKVAIKNELASREAGASIFDAVTQVRVVVPGMKDDGPIYEIERSRPDGTTKIEQSAYQRFREPYEHWKRGEMPSDSGTPLEQWPLMDVAMVAQMKASNIFTVQQLGTLTDAAIDDRRGAREWREKARAWLDQAKGAAGDVEARAENARLKDEVKALQEQMRELLKRENSLGYDKPKRGRTRSEPEDDHIVIPEDEPARL